MTTTQLSKSVVADFSKQFGGEVLAPSASSYDEVRKIWNATIDRKPGLIARCTNAKDVVLSIALARANGLTIAVRGGGHNIAGKGICDDGLLIDRGCRVDAGWWFRVAQSQVRDDG